MKHETSTWQVMDDCCRQESLLAATGYWVLVAVVGRSVAATAVYRLVFFVVIPEAVD